MSMIQSDLLLGQEGGAGGYQIQRSVRFNSADSAYLSRTPASAGNRKTYTLSLWLKRSVLGTNQNFFGRDSDSGFYFQFTPSDNISVIDYNDNAGVDWRYTTTAVYRDTSAWYHITLAVDTTLATASDRVKLYVNGERITQFSTATDPSLNFEGAVNKASAHVFGRISTASAWYFNGYLADVHFIDGQALTPSSFGEFDTNGVWQPKAFSGGSYGTNGFRLDFSDNSAATATTLGKDRSPNGNNWTPNNLSVTAGAGNDSLVDSPTNYGSDTGAGGEIRGNYCTLNPLAKLSTVSTGVPLNGNLEMQSGGYKNIGTIAIDTSDKWYWEGVLTASGGGYDSFGWTTEKALSSWAATNSLFLYANNGVIYSNGWNTGYSTFTTGDVIGVGWDNGTVKFYKNGVLVHSYASNIASGSQVFPIVHQNNTGTISHVNFGQRPFAYTAPSGFKALCTQNLPTPTITKGNTAMDVVLYTGNGSTQSITTSFSPDLVWIKERSDSRFHALCDSVRGDGLLLYSNSTLAEQNIGSTVVDLTSTGFNLGFNSAFTSVSHNWNSVTHVAWAFDAGSSTVTNTAGTISSQVRANASAGFSVVTYTGTGANATVGHGLGVAPQFIIVKARSAAYNWQCYHASLGAATGIQLNLTNAAAGETTLWNSTAPTSTVFSVGTSVGTNESTKTYVAYCFAPVAGYSAFGSYVGNGSADGPVVWTGFRPRWLMFKSSTSGDNWFMLDTTRSSFNVAQKYLCPNLSIAEQDAYNIVDFLSNGFKLRTNSAASAFNGASQTYIWAAFAEHPFSLARAR